MKDGDLLGLVKDMLLAVTLTELSLIWYLPRLASRIYNQLMLGSAFNLDPSDVWTMSSALSPAGFTEGQPFLGQSLGTNTIKPFCTTYMTLSADVFL